MKTIKIQSRCISLCLLIIILFQSCVAYRGKHATLAEAVQSETRVKIVTTEGKRIKYKKVIAANGNYYGIRKRDSILINSRHIKKLKLKNKALSYTLTGFGLAGVTFLTIGIVTFNPGANINVGGSATSK